jgi:hypothetical protein
MIIFNEDLAADPKLLRGKAAAIFNRTETVPTTNHLT